jgi:hypothetical protein
MSPTSTAKKRARILAASDYLHDRARKFAANGHGTNAEKLQAAALLYAPRSSHTLPGKVNYHDDRLHGGRKRRQKLLDKSWDRVQESGRLDQREVGCFTGEWYSLQIRESEPKVDPT